MFILKYTTTMSEYSEGMSHMHGSHMGGGCVHYSGDGRSGPSSTTRQFPPPAWLIADWILDEYNGRPIPEEAKRVTMAPTTNGGLLWLRDYLQQC